MNLFLKGWEVAEELDFIDDVKHSGFSSDSIAFAFLILIFFFFFFLHLVYFKIKNTQDGVFKNI